jgi:hypothetical protein
MSNANPAPNNNNNNNNRQPSRKKRRWYYNSPGKDANPPNKKQKHSPTTPHSDNRENERIENEKQVLKMEQQLHEYFHKTNTAYSYIDDNGIYSYTPAPAQAEASAPTQPPAPAPSTTGQTSANPFMNMTFTPFVPSNAPLFSNPPIPNLWTSIFPIKIAQPPAFPTPSATCAAFTETKAPPPPPDPAPAAELVEIRENIAHIDDLIALCDKYPLSDNKKYNINMSAIHAMRQPLTDLSNMVGMDTIKRTIVDQILYYLQELHIPETKNNDQKNRADSEKDKDLRKGLDDGSVKDDVKNMPNPFFAHAFPAFQASAMEFKPFAIKKPAWGNGNGNVDDFALPTKGDFMHTVIYGPPGSGKTEVAKIIGRIFSNLGILNKKIFKKVSRNDLVAGYLGQTAIKTKDMIKASLGGVLFIDEAYSLGNSEKKDSFAKECVDTLCEALSEHKHNWMVIIAGYEKELNDCFFSLNEGLNSRFTWRFKLDAYKPSELKSIYEKQVRDYGWTIIKDVGATADTLPESWFASRMDYFTTYGRDMETLFTKTKIAHSRRVFCLPMSEKKIITFADLENGFKLFIENPEVNERKERGSGGPYMKTLYL